MKKRKLRGFTFIEVILYIGLFSLLGTALFTFAWDILKLSEQGKTDRSLTESARFAAERMKQSIRSAAGVDQGASVFDNADGKLVLDLLNSSETLTFELQNGQLVMEESGQDPVILQPQDTRTTTLLFENALSPNGLAEHISITMTLETSVQAPLEYASTLTLETGALIKNLGL